MSYTRYDIVADEIQQDLLIAALDDLGALGFEQTEAELTAFFNESSTTLQDVDIILADYRYSRQNIAHQNWNEEWEQHFRPVAVDDFCAVRAHFHQPVTGVRHEIIVTPKMSFGTGHHATTYLMMQQMEGIDFAGKSVFDFGTGTGILSILSVKLGAASVTAVDVDEWSITNAAENFSRNGCNGIELMRSTHVPPQTFDVILANINRNVLLEYMPALKTASAKGGKLLVSGLLWSDEDAILASTGSVDFAFLKKTERQGWISLLFANPA